MPTPSPWTAADLHPDVLLGVATVALAWVWAVRRSREPVSRAHAAAFFSALLVLLLALNGPVHALSEHYLFSAHMVQHLLLTLVVAPLGLAGTPGWMIDRILNALGPVAGPRIARALTRPLPALALYTVALAGWHLPPAYSAALEVHAWHVTEHLVLLGTSVLAWWPVLSASRVAPRIPYGAQILYLFVFGMPMTVVAAMVTTADEVLYPFYAAAPRITPLTPLEDQRLGGLLMWVPAGLIPLAAFTVVFFKWVQSERQEDEPGAVDAQPGASTHGPATSGKTAAASR